MMTSRIRTLAAVATMAVATTLATAPARGDDTELFVGEAVAGAPARPNILFIMDTSGSMNSDVITRPPYESVAVWPNTGNCRSDRVYWSRSGTRPSCNTDQWVPAASFVCASAAFGATTGIWVAPGTSQMAQWRRNNSGVWGWRTLQAGNNTGQIACGHAGGETAAVTFYSGNSMNHWYGAPTETRTRLDIMKSALNNLLANLDNNVNVGLMRYSNDRGVLPNAADGGMVVQAMGRIEDNRVPMQTAINAWRPSGSTPLSETLYEASLYFRGEPVFWGLNSDQCYTGQAVGAGVGRCELAANPESDTPSVPASRMAADQSRYDSPADADCQKNFIVYLTDGLPQSDSNSDATIQALPNFQSINGYALCTGGRVLASDGDGTGQCLDELARWMNESDMRPDRPGVQNVTSYWIGLGDGVAAGTDSLQHVAQRGGGQYYAAGDTAELEEAFTQIISRILAQTTTFTAPTVAVNAFNRTQNLNFLYMSVFKPSATYRWVGNIKKYRITPEGVIRDAQGNAAVDPGNGFFRDNAQSYWSDVVDGANAERGGAAGELTDPANRTIYSNLTVDTGVLSEELSELSDAANLGLANELLLGVVSAVAVAGRPAVTGLVDWAYGIDIHDANGDGSVADARADMGDPLHSRPATVIYDGPEDDPDITLYATTNDGYLHAIDARTGDELWSFVPREMLRRIEPLYENSDVASRVYGLDGAVKIVRLDRNNNGTIEPDGAEINGIPGIQELEKDKVYVFFGMRRGGESYFGLDVTDRDSPRLMWTVGPSTLPGVGQTWSAPTVARVNVNRAWGATNPDKLVLVFGGGYDTGQDVIPYSADDVGNRIFMVDAVTGSLIWRAGPSTDLTAQLRLAKMTNAFPADVRVIDITGDGFADRMYASDMGGRVWRFDIRNGQNPANLAYGGVFASLGTGDLAVTVGAAADEANRRFFYAPDVSLMRVGTANWINVAIGSGHREKPITDETTINRFYSLRDYNIFSQVTNGQYKDDCGAAEASPCHEIITDDDDRLLDVTADLNPVIPAGGVGWRMDLQDDGEKVLAESRTFQNRLYITTYSPQEREYDPALCVATVGLNRLYIVDAATARPVVDLDTATDGVSSLSDRSKELAQGSIAPEAIFVFPTPDEGAADPTADPLCLVGLESCGSGLGNPPVRTYWQQRGTN